MVAAQSSPNFSGTWFCTACEGFEEYLGALGVRDSVRKALLESGSKPTHIINHTGDVLEWSVDAPKSRVTSIQKIGVAVKSKNVHGDVIEMARWEGNTWVVDMKQGTQMQLIQRRWMEGKYMFHTIETVNPSSVTVKRTFTLDPPPLEGRLSGRQPQGVHMPSPSSPEQRPGDLSSALKPPEKPKADFSGRWDAVSCEGFDEYLAASGLSAEVRIALVLKMSKPTHDITMLDPKTMEVKVKSGSGSMSSRQSIGETIVNTNDNIVVTKETARWEDTVWVVDVENTKSGLKSQQRRWIIGDTMYYDVSTTGPQGLATVKRTFKRRINDQSPAHKTTPDEKEPSPAALKTSGRLPPPRVKMVVVEEEVFENERYMPMFGWSSSYLLPSDRRRWSTMEGRNSSDTFPEVKALPPGWQWDGDWMVDLEGAGKDGWLFAIDFDAYQRDSKSGKNKCSPLCYVRRRRWVRRRKCKATQQELEANGMAGLPDDEKNPLDVSGTPPDRISWVSAMLIALGVWLSNEHVSLQVTGSRRLLLQNVHLLWAVFWLLCGFFIGELMAKVNDNLLLDIIMKRV